MLIEMDRDRFSFIAHSRHAICNPVSSAAVDEAIRALAVPRGGRVIDIGAGKGEMLARIAERQSASCLAIEKSPRMAGACRERAALITSGRLDVIETDAKAWLSSRQAGDAPFDAALCVGSTHACGSFALTVESLRALTRPGGAVIVGEGFWASEPDPGYLAALGATRDELRTHDENIRALSAAGLDVTWHTVATSADWAEYEWCYLWNVERFANDNPNDPDRDAMLSRARAWHEIVQKWGRFTLGFGLYVARRS